MTRNKKDILYYDGQCPLCAKEIQWLKKYNTGLLAFADIHQSPDAPSSTSKTEMLQRLHLLTSEGIWVIGLDATVRSWSHTPYGCLLKPLRWPIIKPIADLLYQYWAIKRYKKRYQCLSCNGEQKH